MKSLVPIVLGILVVGIPISSQVPVGAKPSFEVATVKRNTSPQGGSRLVDQPGGRFVATRVTLRTLLGFAYHGKFFGGPSWIESDLWDIEAKAEEGVVPPRTRMPDLSVPPDTIALMVQSLLEDRFHLKLHSEIRQMPIYELTIAKGGPKTKLSNDQSPPQLPDPQSPPRPGGPIPRGAMTMGRGNFEVSAISIDNLARALGALYLGRTVIDKTGLKGLYDIKLQWTPDPAFPGPAGPGGPVGPEATPADPSGPSIFTALQEQLGLRLESSTGPEEVLVIDGVQRPSEN